MALHDDATSVVRDAVSTARVTLGSDSAFAAVRHEHGGFDMDMLEGIHEPRFRDVTVQPGRGLGGQVIDEGAPRAVDDYPRESSITADYRGVVKREGLGGIACVPVAGPNGTEVLLYVSMHRRGAPGDNAIEQLQRIAGYAGIGLQHIAARARERELAVLRERQRLATALHDSVAQSLFAIGVAAQQSREAEDPSALAEQLERIEAVATTARHELRETLARLNRAPDGIAFEAVFEAELRLFERRTGRRVWITRHGEPRELGADPGELLIDSVREGLRNAAKHGGGETVLAHLAYGSDRVLLSLQTELDAGRARRPIVAGSGLGLLRERTERLGGSLDLAIDDDGTAALRIELPGL